MMINKQGAIAYAIVCSPLTAVLALPHVIEASGASEATHEVHMVSQGD